MEGLIDIGEDYETAAKPLLSDAVIDAIGELLAVVASFVAAKLTLRRGDLETLRQITSLLAQVLRLANQLLVRWHRRSTRAALANLGRANQNRDHPPQAWAAP